MDVPARHQILDDELVVSWLARLCRTGAFFNERLARKALIGIEKVRLHPYLTSHLKHISSSTNHGVQALIMKHTLYPLFWWCGLDPELRLKESMLEDNGGQTIILAGLPQSKLHFYEGLKYCPLCVSKSKKEHGFGYFKAFHQIPGIDACPDHKCILHGLSSGDYGYDRHLLLPPSNTQAVQATSFQVGLAGFARVCLQQSCEETKPLDYRNMYKEELLRLGFVTRCHRVRISKLTESIQEFYRALEFGGELGLPLSLQTFAFAGPLLRDKTHFCCHPTKHILFMFWLCSVAGKSLSELVKVQPWNTKLKNNSTVASIQGVKKANGEVVAPSSERIAEAIEKVKALVEAKPNWRRKEIKEVLNADFFYLYHHAPSILEDILPDKEPPSHPDKDWLHEDDRIYAEILKIEKIENLSLSKIDHLAQGRGFLRKSLHKLPRTLCLLRHLKKI